jgi:hypothetical protein
VAKEGRKGGREGKQGNKKGTAQNLQKGGHHFDLHVLFFNTISV